MSSRNGKYDSLREQYPDVISLEQLYKICKISKRSASYLVVQGIIPATDTGRRTWRYEILLDDVITYLRRREQVGSMIPVGAVTQSKKEGRNEYRKYLNLAKEVGGEKLKQHFLLILKDYPDVIPVAVASRVIGLSTKTIHHAIRKGQLKHILIGRDFLLPKPFLVEFMASSAYLNGRSCSCEFKEVLKSILSNS